MCCMRRAPDVCGGRATAALPLYPRIQHNGKSLMSMSSCRPLLTQTLVVPYTAMPKIDSPVHRHAAAAYAVKHTQSRIADQVPA